MRLAANSTRNSLANGISSSHSANQRATDQLPPHTTLAELRRAASGCRACDLWKAATQTVFGEGTSKARIMLVGEQPGDQEDRLGHILSLVRPGSCLTRRWRKQELTALKFMSQMSSSTLNGLRLNGENGAFTRSLATQKSRRAVLGLMGSSKLSNRKFWFVWVQ